MKDMALWKEEREFGSSFLAAAWTLWEALDWEHSGLGTGGSSVEGGLEV